MRKAMDIVFEITVALYAGVYTYTAIAKLKGHKTFVRSLSDIEFVKNYRIQIAWLVPIVELIIVMALLIPLTRRKGLIAAITLMTIFTMYITTLMLFAPHLPCSCGGIIQQLTWKQHLIINTAFILIGLLAIYHNNNTSVQNRRSRIPV